MRWLWLSVLVVILDQLSKIFVAEHLAFKPPMELTSWLNFVLAHNTGAAFSFLGDAGGWQRWFFAVLASIVSIVLIVWILKLPKKACWIACSLALILGGAVGNLIDRVRFGYVIDFIDFHIDSWPWSFVKFNFDTWKFETFDIYNWHFATFNIADTAIFIGAVMMLIDAFFLKTTESDSS